MNRQEVWQELAKRSGLAVDKLQEALTSETEVEIELLPVNILTDEQLETLKQQVGKDSAKNGSKTLVEMQVKELRDKHSLEFEGKTIENLMSAFAEKQIKDAKIEPTKKVDELKTSLQNLQKQYETDLGLKDTENSSLKNKLNEFKVNGDLYKHLPEGLKGIDQNDFMTLVKTTASFDYDEDGNLVVKKGDKIIKDKMENPIKPKDYLTEFATTKNWLESNGRGGSDDSGDLSNEFKTMHDVMKHMDVNKIDPRSVEGVKMIADFNNKK